MDEARIEYIGGGEAQGAVAQRLLANGMNVLSLRTLGTLRTREWELLDGTVVQIGRQRLVGVNDLISRGLSYSLNGLATTVLQTENLSDMEDAELSMDAATAGQRDRVVFGSVYLPLPIILKEFQLNSRQLNTSRNMGDPLDTTQAGVAMRKVAEKAEDMLMNGISAYNFGGGTIRGYTDHPNRNTVSLSVNWDTATGAQIIANVISMVQAAIDDRHYGPFGMYIPTGYQTPLDADYVSGYSGTIRERIMKIDGIEFIKVADKLTANNVVLVELMPETARMVVGLQPTTVEWETRGGFVLNYMVMAILIPQIRADQDLRSGIIHLS